MLDIRDSFLVKINVKYSRFAVQIISKKTIKVANKFSAVVVVGIIYIDSNKENIDRVIHTKKKALLIF
jgi:hypothetical protein